MLDGVLLLWFILTGLSLAFVLWDSLINNGHDARPGARARRA
jgi:hypothetical protein